MIRLSFDSYEELVEFCTSFLDKENKSNNPYNSVASSGLFCSKCGKGHASYEACNYSGVSLYD